MNGAIAVPSAAHIESRDRADTAVDDSAALSLLAAVTPALLRSTGLARTLEAIVHAVTETLGFRAAALNLVTEDPQVMRVAAVAGPPEVTGILTGCTHKRSHWDELIALAETWGKVYFVDHRHADSYPDMVSWVSDESPIEADDAWHPRDVLFAPLVDSHGELIGMLSVDMPVDGRRPNALGCRLLELFATQASVAIENASMHTRLAATADLFGAMFEQSPIAIALVDEAHCYLRVNAALCRFLGYDANDLIGLSLFDVTHPDDIEISVAWIKAQQDGEQGALEERFVRVDGRVVWGRVRNVRLSVQDGEYRLLTQIEDITEAKRQEDRLIHDSLHDSLTGLPNRALLLDRLSGALARAGRSGRSVAVLFCDLDYFKLVNDTHGHAAGDALILAVGERLRGALQDTAGRFGGDEFVVLAEDLGSVADVVSLAERLAAAVRRPVSLNTTEITPSVSIGIAVAGAHASPEQLLGDADAALYRAKAAGRGGWQLFDGAMREAASAELALRAELSAALEEEEFELYYQPIIDTRAMRIVGREALLRWRHPTRGLLLPGEFLDVVIGSDLEAPITEWVIDRACSAASIWGSGGGAPYVSVNVSTNQLVREDLLPHVLSCLERHELEPHRLMIELTEDRLLEHPNHAAQVARLRRHGVRVAIDDFGTGYASLSALQRLPVDTVKIDRSFVAALPDDEVCATVVSSVAVLAQLLGLTAIAEGVETADQATALRGLGVHVAQGWLYGRPTPTNRRRRNVEAWQAIPT